MDKLTKIIATIGPSSDSSEMIENLIIQGADILRLNFKHSTTDWHKERIQRINKSIGKLKTQTATLIDLQGPEIRLTMPVESIEIMEGEKILLSESVFETREKGFSFTNPEIIKNLKEDQQVSADDGHFEFTVKKDNDKVYLLSYSSGTLLNNKSVSVIAIDFDFPTIHDKDKEGILLAKEEGIDFIALSFVRNGKDIKNLREEMSKIGLNARVVSKIETAKAIENIDEIIEASDAIMVARGDLGVELPLEQVPYYQKEIIKKCLEKGIPVITATQMLESMTQNSIPTRAEVSDVANAVYDFTDAVMLSGETASGKYPIESVKVMNRIIKFSEEKTHIPDIRRLINYELTTQSEMICDSAFNLYKELKAKDKAIKGFVVFTRSGKTSRMLSRYRPHVPIFAFCSDESLVKKLSINYGVIPVLQNTLREKNEILREHLEFAINILKDSHGYKKGDGFIVLHGDFWNSDSGTTTIRAVEV